MGNDVFLMVSQTNLDEEAGLDGEEDEENNNMDIPNNVQITPDEPVAPPHQNGEVNPLEVCTICGSDKPKGTAQSIKSHIQYYVRQGDPDHIDGEDEAYTIIEDWIEAHPTKKEPAKGKKVKPPTKPRPPSVPVGLRRSQTELRDDQRWIAADLAQETGLSKQRAERYVAMITESNLEKKWHKESGQADAEESQQRDFMAEEQRKEDILKSKDREISELHKRMEKEKDRMHEKQIAQISATHNIELKFKEMDHKFSLDMQKLKTVTARSMGDFKGEMNRTKIRGINTFFDLLVEDYRDKKRSRKQEIEQIKSIELVEGGDEGILSRLPDHLVKRID